MSSEEKRYSKIEELKDLEVAQKTLNFLLKNCTQADFLFELHNIAIAQGTNLVAEKSGISRENLYRILSPHANPYWSTLIKIIHAMGFEVQVVPIAEIKKNIKSSMQRINSLASNYPEIISEWHFTKNENLSPYDVTSSSHKKIWWKCSKNNDHEWQAIISSKVKGLGCPYCQAINVLSHLKKYLSQLYPELASQWHPTNNGKLTPFEVTPESSKKVWWKCLKNNDHEWCAAIKSRVAGRGCPACLDKK